MSRSLYLYTRLQPAELTLYVEKFLESFEEYLKDHFSEEELQTLESYLDQMAEVVGQPLGSELFFEDFYAPANEEEKQRAFFATVKSCICLDHMPFLENNPFQVTYLQELLNGLGEVLVDQGGVHELQFKDVFLKGLERYKNARSFERPDDYVPALKRVQTKAPVEPIDFLVLDVYRELDRIKSQGKLTIVLQGLQDRSEKVKTIFFVMREERLDADVLLMKTKMGAKDFDDHLEKLKFYLRKC